MKLEAQNYTSMIILLSGVVLNSHVCRIPVTFFFTSVLLHRKIRPADALAGQCRKACQSPSVPVFKTRVAPILRFTGTRKFKRHWGWDKFDASIINDSHWLNSPPKGGLTIVRAMA